MPDRTCTVCHNTDECGLCEDCCNSVVHLNNIAQQNQSNQTLMGALASLGILSASIPRWSLLDGLQIFTKPCNCRLKVANSVRKAPFIVIEGIDASGKTTHMESILKELTRLGYSSQTVIFPNNRTPLGRFLKSQIQEVDSINPWLQHVLFSLHLWEWMPWICQYLEAGIAVVCERYAWSGVVYTAASATDLTIQSLMFCDEGMLQPDFVVLLNTSAVEARRRRRDIPAQFEDLEIQECVWSEFQNDLLWKGVIRLDHQTRPDPLESQRHLEALVSKALNSLDPSFPWNRLWERTGTCITCQARMGSVVLDISMRR